MNFGDRPPGSTGLPSRADRTLPHPLGGGKTRPGQPVRAAPVRRAHEIAREAANSVALRRAIEQFVEMTKSCATHQGRERDPGRGAALALQCGGAHGASARGVLDRLLDAGLAFHAVCGVSSGAPIRVIPGRGAGAGVGARRTRRCSRGDAAPAPRTAEVRRRRAIAPAGHCRGNPGCTPVIQLTPNPAVGGYHCLPSYTSAVHLVAAMNSVEPCA
jgi:hypothetical protein